MKLKLFWIFFLTLISLGSASAASKDEAASAKAMNAKAAVLKQEVLTLTKSLDSLEQSLLYPPNVKLGVFLSLSSKSRFKLDSIELFVNDDLVFTHLYEDADIQSLLNGGLQQLYLGSVAPGTHTLTASFNGQGRIGGYFKRKKALRFKKSNEARYIQLIVSESASTGEPIFKVKQW